VSDKELSLIRAWLEQPETVPDSNKFKAHSPEVQQLWAQRQSLEIRDGLLYTGSIFVRMGPFNTGNW